VIATRPGPGSARLDAIFSALADPTRRAILARLSQKGVTIKQVAEEFPMSLPAVSKHLRVLEKAGLLSREKRGRENHLQLEAEALKEASEWMAYYEQFWSNQLDSLGSFLAAEQDKEQQDAD